MGPSPVCKAVIMEGSQGVSSASMRLVASLKPEQLEMAERCINIIIISERSGSRVKGR